MDLLHNQVVRAAAVLGCSPAYWSIFGITLAVGAVTMILLCILAARWAKNHTDSEDSAAATSGFLPHSPQQGTVNSSSNNPETTISSGQKGELDTRIVFSSTSGAPEPEEFELDCMSFYSRASAPTSSVAGINGSIQQITSTRTVTAGKSISGPQHDASASSTASSDLSSASDVESPDVDVEASSVKVPSDCQEAPSSSPLTSILSENNNNNQDSIHWSFRIMLKLYPQVFVAGVLLGAWPISPIILAAGVHPQVAAGTSKVLLFMITGGTGLSFAASKELNLSYTLVYGLTNAIATPIGVYVVDTWIKRTRRPSIIVMLTMLRLAASVIVQLAFSLIPALMLLSKGSLTNAGFFSKAIC